MTGKLERLALWSMLARLGRALLVALLGITALTAGFGASAIAFPRPKIGIIHVDTTIDPLIRPYFTIPLRYAAEHHDIAAVVLLVDSPGGEATTSEELFYRVVELRSKKPVVASINRLGASGAYYTAVGSNYIYAKPAALVGSIGVRAGIPEPAPPQEASVATGPFKGSGSSQIDWIRSVEVIKETFVTNVYDQRLYALQHMHPQSRADLLPTKDQIATGQVWIAPVAYDIGLIDALGSNLDAIEKAAELAHVSNYKVIDLTSLTLFDDPTFIDGATPPDPLQLRLLLQQPGFEDTDPDSQDYQDYIEEGPWPTFYHLYVPPAE